ncbi:MAG: LamG-like jellyroll fold domain-containing protein [Planctomycetota bacterium]|jgi:hypothetical protein
MCRTLTYLIVFGLAVGTTSAQADLIHHLKLDEDTTAGDTIAVDSVRGLNGTIQGARPVPGKTGNALSFDGSDDLITIMNFVPPQQGTIVFWMDPGFATSKQRVFGAGGDYEVIVYSDGRVRNELFAGGSGTLNSSTGAVESGRWSHIAVTYAYDGTGPSTALGVYVNGDLDTVGVAGEPSVPTDTTLLLGHRAGAGGGERYGGLLDDIQIYNEVLNAEQIKWLYDNLGKVTAPLEKAKKPYPADGAIDVPRDVVLSWTPGVYAPAVNGHKVYLSENFNDVNDGIGGIAQDANSYAPDPRLELGTTYYWRVDEVNGPPDYTVYEGDVWQFTTEPVGYAIENITATASSTHQVDMGPENTINGSGLDANDLHSNEGTDMWLSGNEPLGAWIEYEFDKVYKLHEMWVWNSNQMIEALVGFGVKDVTVEYSSNGTDYTTLGATHEVAQALGTADYAHDTPVDFGGAVAKYVRLTANSNWGFLTQYGLSEVHFFYIPICAREPSPDSGATNVDVDVTLGFRAGREAAQHDVYLSSDEQAVIDGSAPVTTVTETSYGPLSLDLDMTYYWKINEVNMAESPTTWDGDVWNFTTQEYFVVDDFESYNDLDPTDPESNRIFNTWIDGYEVPTNGSLVGYENPPFCEQTIVHSGKQSMPLAYSNTGGAAYSEAERTFAIAQNWTKAGATTLVLYFQGAEGNTGQLYVKVDGSKVVYDGDAGDIAKAEWKQWNIDLASLGASLQNITKLAIGIDGNGASGTLYVDDIRLYPPR